MACPACNSSNMIFGGHHGMDHNVCENCGLVIELTQFTVDPFQKGARDVAPNYDAKPDSYRSERSKSAQTKSRAHRESIKMLNHLMDSLKLPTSVRRLSLEFHSHSSRLNKSASVGASVYLAMKYSNMPVTIRYIANYLQVSHYEIGRIMGKLEKRSGFQKQNKKTFGVDELIPLIFNQANFGPGDDGKKMMSLMLSKTEKFVMLLQECQATTGYEPHLVILASGYLIWKNLNFYKWKELNLSKETLSRRPGYTLSLSVFLSEMRIQISNKEPLTSKISMMKRLLFKLSKHVPWLSVQKLKMQSIIYHIDDILKYKSQIIDMTVIEMGSEMNDSLDISKAEMEDDDKEGEAEEKKFDNVAGPLDSSDSMSTLKSDILSNQSKSKNHFVNGNDFNVFGKDNVESSHRTNYSIDNSNNDSKSLTFSKARFIKVKEIIDSKPSNISITLGVQTNLTLSTPNSQNIISKERFNEVKNVIDLNLPTSNSKKFIKDSSSNRHTADKTIVKTEETMLNGYKKLLNFTHPEIAKPRLKRKAKNLPKSTNLLFETNLLSRYDPNLLCL